MGSYGHEKRGNLYFLKTCLFQNVSLPDGSSLDGLPSDQTSELEFDNDYPEEPEEPEEEERVGSPASNGSEKADAFEVERIIQVEKSENVSKKVVFLYFFYFYAFSPWPSSSIGRISAPTNVPWLLWRI